MEPLPPTALRSSNTTSTARCLEWEQLLELIVEFHELGNGVVVDLPANRYEDVVDLIDREVESSGEWLNLSLGRKENVILLTATSENPDGHSLIRSMMGLAS